MSVGGEIGEVGQKNSFMALRALRNEDGEEPVLLHPDDIERLARLAPSAVPGPRERLTRARFRYHEGDF